MLCQIIIFVLLYCLISGNYKKYVTINIPIPGITKPFMLGSDVTISPPVANVRANVISRPNLISRADSYSYPQNGNVNRNYNNNFV